MLRTGIWKFCAEGSKDGRTGFQRTGIYIYIDVRDACLYFHFFYPRSASLQITNSHPHQSNSIPTQLQLNLTSPPTNKMKSLTTLTLGLFALVTPALAAPWDPYPAPCGRGVPSGRCATEKMCAGWGGAYVGRECTFYGVEDVGCCYNMKEL